MRVRWIAVLVAAGAALALGQAGEIHGRVVSTSDGEPLALVQIRVVDTELQASTDDDGKFQIASVPPGSYVLQAAAVGFRLATQDFTIAAGESKKIDLLLTSSTAQRRDA